jgi:FkbM family methyltransferase
MIDVRAWRRRLGRLLPEFVKRSGRGWLYGFRASVSRLDVSIHMDADRCVVRLPGLPELHAPGAERDDLEFHLLRNGDSIDELANLIAVGRDPGGLLLDVGGHNSLLASLFCLAAPGNRAVSFEPSPVLRARAGRIRTLNRLEERLSLNAAAIGDTCIRVTAHAGSSGFIDFGQAPPGVETFEVSMVTLDAECDRLGEFPSVVKIDIEGFEDRAIAGASRLLAQHPPILLLEFHLDLLEQRGVDVRQLLATLEGYGYRFFATTGRPISARAVAMSPAAVTRFVARLASSRQARGLLSEV